MKIRTAAEILSKYKIDGEEPTGAMVALIPDYPAKLVQPGHEEAGALHVTVKFLGKAVDWSMLSRNGLDRTLDRLIPKYGPFEFTIKGVEMLGKEGDALALVLENSKVEQFFNDVHALTPSVELTWPTYKPHMTLAYERGGCIPDVSHLVGQTFTCSRVRLAFGPDVTDKLLVGDISKGDRPGHPFRGNQWTGRRAAPNAARGTGTIVRTGVGEVHRPSDSQYEMTLGRTTKSFKDDGTLDNARGSISSAINPLTGHRMSNTEMGAIMEAMISERLADTKEFKANLGAGMHHVIGHSQQQSKNRDARGAIDIVTDTHALELKTISLAAKDPKVSIKADEVGRKHKAAKAMKKKGAILIATVDHDSTVRVYAFISPKGFAPTTNEGRIQIKRNQRGWQDLSHGRVIEIGTIPPKKSTWQRAAKKAGWDRDANGQLKQRERVKQQLSKSMASDLRVSKSDAELVIGVENGDPYIEWRGTPPSWVDDLEDL